MVEVTGIEKRYRKKVVLDGASFQADAGTCVGIVGENGCGKTTLLSILSGTVKADQGSVRLGGREALGHPKVFSESVAYVPQENPIMEELSVWDNLTLWFKGNRDKLEQDLEQGAAGMLGLRDVISVPAGKLSGGMKKRLSIACALSNQASVMIMDEPGAALDLVCKEEIRHYLEGYLKQGKTVILASHELEELALCNKMYVLKQGKLKETEIGLSAKELIHQFLL